MHWFSFLTQCTHSKNQTLLPAIKGNMTNVSNILDLTGAFPFDKNMIKYVHLYARYSTSTGMLGSTRVSRPPRAAGSCIHALQGGKPTVQLDSKRHTGVHVFTRSRFDSSLKTKLHCIQCSHMPLLEFHF